MSAGSICGRLTLTAAPLKRLAPMAGMAETARMTTPAPSVPKLFDRDALRAHRARAQKLRPVGFLFERVAADLSDRLAVVLRQFQHGVDLGGSGFSLHEILASRVARFDAIDLLAHDDNDLRLAPASLDLAVSVLALQFADDVPGLLSQLRRALKPDGLFIAAMLGGDTLTELRQSFAAAEVEVEGGLSPRVAPFADLRDAGALLQRAGFALPVSDLDRIVVRYDNVFGLMRDLRGMGAANALIARRRTPLRRATLLRMAEIYAERFSDSDGRIRATFDCLWLSGWSPHESQQKPLRPGSAKQSLEQAVKGRRDK